MAGQGFAGKWQSISQENFDDYMKAVGVGYFTRKAAVYSTTTIDMKIDGDTWKANYKIYIKTGSVEFKLGEDFEETTPDGRHVISNVVIEGDTLIWTQKGEPCDSTLTRHLEEDGNIMVEECKAKDVVCIRKYKRVESL